MTDHFRDESFQAISCTDTNNGKQTNRTTPAPETQKTLALAKTNIKLQRPGLVALYNIWHRKRSEPILITAGLPIMTEAVIQQHAA